MAKKKVIETENMIIRDDSMITLQGVKTHNLKNIDIKFPKNKIISITGVSGSGKSSLAFDTIYKEGQFKYIESLSSYLRQFFNLGHRPDIEYSSGLSPAIAIEQNKRIGNSRSTVGTLTEIDDYLRLLFSKLGDSYCYKTGEHIKAKTIDQITEEIIKLYADKKVYVVQELTDFDSQAKFLKFVKKNRLAVEQGAGFTRYLLSIPQQPEKTGIKSENIGINNINISKEETSIEKKDTKPKQNNGLIEYFYLESPNIQDKYFPLKVYGIFDRVTIEPKKMDRLKEDIVKILARTDKFGIFVINEDEKAERDNEIAKSIDKDVFIPKRTISRFTTKNMCATSGVTYPDFAPHHFSPNRGEGACPTCHGMGEMLQVDFEKILDPQAPFLKAIIPRRDSTLGQTILTKLAQKYSMQQEKLRKDQPERFKEIIINGDQEVLRLGMGGKFVSMNYKGIQDILTTQYTKGLLTVDFQAMLHMESCETCRGSRLRVESLNVFLENKEFQNKGSNRALERINEIKTNEEYIGFEILDSKKFKDRYNIFDLQRLSVEQLVTFFESFIKNTKKPKELVDRILTPLIDRIKMIESLGLTYLGLNRQVDTLSGGEIQRLRLAKQLGNRLSGIIYVLDEPTIGLDEVEIHRVIKAIKSLQEIGNTIVVVEHNDEFIKASDRVIEIGPMSGDFGGNVVFNGPYKDFLKANTLTSQYITGKTKVEINFSHKPSSNLVRIKKASKHNLQEIDVDLQLGSFTIVTGPSGAGKTTLMYDILFKFLNEKDKFIQGFIRLQLLKKGLSWNEILATSIMNKEDYEHYRGIALMEFYKEIGVDKIFGHENIENTIYIDQASIGKTPRSCPATFIGVFDEIRKLYAGSSEAKYLGFTSGHFSFNSNKGACPECNGYGYKKVELQFLPDTYVPCDVCRGKRYKQEILSVTRRGKTISEILEMYIHEALELFEDIHFIHDELQLMNEIGLGYLRLGQPAHTLSGGESQRLKLSRHLVKSYRGHTVYFLDEPTVGLHPHDIEKLLKVLKKFLDNGDTILMIEHDKSLLKFADNVIYLQNGELKNQTWKHKK